jgi:hypothetical protein
MFSLPNKDGVEAAAEGRAICQRIGLPEDPFAERSKSIFHAKDLNPAARCPVRGAKRRIFIISPEES